jgi:hypothetical protein
MGTKTERSGVEISRSTTAKGQKQAAKGNGRRNGTPTLATVFLPGHCPWLLLFFGLEMFAGMSWEFDTCKTKELFSLFA